MKKLRKLLRLFIVMRTRTLHKYNRLLRLQCECTPRNAHESAVYHVEEPLVFLGLVGERV